MDLTERQWQIVEPLLPKPRVRADRRGRPWRDPRDVLNRVLWILRTGAPWQDMPDRYPPYQTCHRRFQQWVQEGTLEQLLHALAQDLKEQGGLDLTECFIDGTFAPATKGALLWERPSGAKGPRPWQWQTALVFLSPYAQPVLRRMK
jgi:transposase